MKWSYSTILRTLACLALLATGAWAEKVSAPTAPPDVVVQDNCDLTGYKSEFQTLSPPASIPDNTGASVTVGPILLPADGTMIGDVVIDLSMSHTWIGDLIVQVGYDATCDGSIDAGAVLMGRVGRTAAQGCTPAGTPFGCSLDLSCNNTYNFDDTATASIGLTSTGACQSTPTVIAGGCYKPTGPCASPLAIFEQYRKGGCWYLTVSDNAGGDTGTICRWSVHIKNNVIIGTEPASWSVVKKLYN